MHVLSTSVLKYHGVIYYIMSSMLLLNKYNVTDNYRYSVGTKLSITMYLCAFVFRSVTMYCSGIYVRPCKSWVCVVKWHLVSVRTFGVMYDHTLSSQITRVDTRPQVKWAINLVITYMYGHFNFPQWFVSCYNIQRSSKIRIRIRIRIRIYLLARRNLLWDILRLPSSRRAALGLYVILTLWRGRGANQPPYALLHRSSPRYALRHGRRRQISMYWYSDTDSEPTALLYW